MSVAYFRRFVVAPAPLWPPASQGDGRSMLRPDGLGCAYAGHLASEGAV